jgi:ligand-binding sensor domain-containing protein
MNKLVRTSTTLIVLLVTLLCVIVLLVLNLSVATANMRMSDRYAETVVYQYELETEGQMWLSEVDGKVEGDLQKMIGDENKRHLLITIEKNENSKYNITEWKMESPKIKEEILDNLWKGE